MPVWALVVGSMVLAGSAATAVTLAVNHTDSPRLALTGSATTTAPSSSTSVTATTAAPTTLYVAPTTVYVAPTTVYVPPSTLSVPHGTLAIEGSPAYGQEGGYGRCTVWRLNFINNSDTEIIEVTFAVSSGDYWDIPTNTTLPATTPAPVRLNLSIPAHTSQVQTFQVCTSTPEPADPNYQFTTTPPQTVSYEWITGQYGSVPF